MEGYIERCIVVMNLSSSFYQVKQLNENLLTLQRESTKVRDQKELEKHLQGQYEDRIRKLLRDRGKD